MVVPARSEVAETLTPLESLLELAQCAGQESLAVVLTTVAQTIRTVAGFDAVVVSIYRPAWDDYFLRGARERIHAGHPADRRS